MKNIQEKNESGKKESYIPAFICLILIVLTLTAYWQVQYCEFVNYDDPIDVFENSYVLEGVTTKGIVWAFTTTLGNNWHPLALISHMVSSDLFGMDAGSHHIVNLLFHLANVLLLFVILRRMTGCTIRSAFVATLFSLHPLHVESVAWVTERKDVLSVFFFMTTLFFYDRYVKHPNNKKYLCVFLSFALGLMSKPMLVTLPMVLLLLDFWPLQRFKILYRNNSIIVNSDLMKNGLRLILEKIPLFCLTFLSMYAAIYAEQAHEGITSFENLPIYSRISNALVSYFRYIEKMLWPTNLSIFYPYKYWPFWLVSLSAFLLIGISWLCLKLHKKHPYLIVGWLWYLGTLVPVVGLVQVSIQSIADRYAYLPLTGLYIACSWGLFDISKNWKYSRIFLSLAGAILISALLILTRLQVNNWQNSVMLFKHALNVTKDNFNVHYLLAMTYKKMNDKKNEFIQYKKALRIRPDAPNLHYIFGLALTEEGILSEGLEHYLEALRLKPNDVDTVINIANNLAMQKKYNQAILYYNKGLVLLPNDADLHYNLGLTLASQQKYKEAIKHFYEALRIRPEFNLAKRNLLFSVQRAGISPNSLRRDK